MEENAIKRVQPHNNTAEQSVIGSMLMNRDVIGELMDVLDKGDFYNAQYGILFEAMTDLYSKGKPVDMITLSEKLRMMDVPEEICSVEFMAEIMQNVPTSARARDHANLVKDKASLRRLIRLSEDIAKDCYLGSDEAETLIERAESDIFKLARERSGNNDDVSISEIIMNVIAGIEEAAKNGGKINGLSTGFKDLDSMLTGMRAGQLIVLAARPGMGKTAFALNIARDVAVVHKTPVAIFSLEMAKEELVSRMIAIDAMVDSKKMAVGDLTDDDWDKVIESTDVIANSPLYIYDNSGITLGELLSKCRNLKKNHDIGLIILDYLQLLNSKGKVESRQNFIAEASRTMKTIAKELKVPVIALSQLKREVDNKNEHKPALADLRESGAIEQDADVVMFIHRDEYYNPDTTTKPQTAEIIIAKQRAGETGSVDLRWIGKYTKFANPEKHYTQPQ